MLASGQHTHTSVALSEFNIIVTFVRTASSHNEWHLSEMAYCQRVLKEQYILDNEIQDVQQNHFLVYQVSIKVFHSNTSLSCINTLHLQVHVVVATIFFNISITQ